MLSPIHSLFFYHSALLFAFLSSLLPSSFSGQDLFAEILKELLAFPSRVIIQCIERGQPLITNSCCGAGGC